MKSFTQSCTEFFLTWIMLSEFHRGVALFGVVGRGLTALSNSLLRRRFLLRRNDNCSQMRGRIARFTSQWNSYLEYYTSYLAPMGVEIFFKVLLWQAQHDKTLKKIVADSGTKSLYGILNSCFWKKLFFWLGFLNFDFINPVLVEFIEVDGFWRFLFGKLPLIKRGI